MNTFEISKVPLDLKGTSRITGLRSRSPSYTRDEVEYGLLKRPQEKQTYNIWEIVSLSGFDLSGF